MAILKSELSLKRRGSAMPSHAQIEDALTYPDRFLQIIPDIKTFQEVADQPAYQERMLHALLKHSEISLGILKNAIDIRNLASHYLKEELYLTLLTQLQLYSQVITEPHDLKSLVDYYEVLLFKMNVDEKEKQEKTKRFCDGMIQRLLQDREVFLRVFHHAPDPGQADIWKYDDQKLCCGTMRHYPQYIYLLWEAEIEYVVTLLYAEFEKTKNKTCITILEQTIEDIRVSFRADKDKNGVSRKFNEDVYNCFKSLTTDCLAKVEGKAKEILTDHLEWLAETHERKMGYYRLAFPSAEELAASLQKANLYAVPADEEPKSSTKAKVEVPLATPITVNGKHQ